MMEREESRGSCRRKGTEKLRSRTVALEALPEFLLDGAAFGKTVRIGVDRGANDVPDDMFAEFAPVPPGPLVGFLKVANHLVK